MKNRNRTYYLLGFMGVLVLGGIALLAGGGEFFQGRVSLKPVFPSSSSSYVQRPPAETPIEQPADQSSEPVMGLSLSAQFSGATYNPGQVNVPIYAFNVISNTTSNKTLKHIALDSWVDCDENGQFAQVTASKVGFCSSDLVGVSAKDMVSDLALYNGETKISDTANFDVYGRVNFNMNHLLNGKIAQAITVRGNVKGMNNADSLPNRLKLSLPYATTTWVQVLDSEGNLIDKNDIELSGTDNRITYDEGIRITISN